MCGIVGIYSRWGSVSADSLRRAVARLHHRGPDGSQTWVASNGRAGLGHARLSIIDLVGGTQPLANEDESCRLVVNGELYDFQRIQRDLESRGHKLATRSDSEILLHLYEEQGMSCLRHLRGEFAFALWDSNNDVFIAGRDRFGIKPLYWAQHEGALYVASEPKALFAMGVPARWDEEAYFQMTQVYLEQDRSLYDGVFQIPPGHYLTASNGHMQLLKYWDFDYPLKESMPPPRSDAEYIAQLRESLEEAVRLRMHADVPVGVYLSGGIDSQAILGMAARHAKRIPAFTVSFVENEDYNEEPIAREMADHVGAEFVPLHIDSDQIADNFGDAIEYGEGLLSNEAAVAKYLLSRKVRDYGIKVVLTGQGADDVFGGYAHFRRDLFLHGSAGQDPAVSAQMLAELKERNAISSGIYLPAGDMNIESVKGTLGFVPSCLENYAGNGARVRPLLSQDFRAKFGARDAFRVFLSRIDVERQLRGRDPVNQSLYLWSKTTLVNSLLVWGGDRVEMPHSVEGRVPFLDHHVVELARDLPINLKIRGKVEKFALREAMRPFVTESVYGRQKHPFQAPPSTFKPQSRLFQLVQDSLRGSALKALPFYDQKAVIDLLDRLPTMSQADLRIWNVPIVRMLGSCFLQQRYRL